MQFSTCVLSPWASVRAPDYSCQGCNQLWGATTCCQNGHLSVMFCRFSDCSLKGFYQEVLNMSRHGAGAITFIQTSLKYPKQNMWILSKDWLYLKKNCRERKQKDCCPKRFESPCRAEFDKWSLDTAVKKPSSPKTVLLLQFKFFARWLLWQCELFTGRAGTQKVSPGLSATPRRFRCSGVPYSVRTSLAFLPTIHSIFSIRPS